MIILFDGGHFDLWNYLPQYALVLVTLLLFIATFKMARESSRNIDLATKIAKREWRPELFIDIGKVEELRVNVIGSNMSIEIPLYYRNSGGSPALQISAEHVLNRDEKPYFDPRKEITKTGFSIWPGQNVPSSLRISTEDFKPSDTLCLHFACLYFDREGHKYLQETVLAFVFVQDKLQAMITFKNYEYDWSKDKWL
jgi:hypothetical protein